METTKTLTEIINEGIDKVLQAVKDDTDKSIVIANANIAFLSKVNQGTSIRVRGYADDALFQKYMEEAMWRGIAKGLEWARDNKRPKRLF